MKIFDTKAEYAL